MTGVIVKGIGGFYYIKAEDGIIYECKARGIFRKDKIIPMIGDKVCIEVKNGKGSIVEIKNRTTSLIRPPVANVDSLVLVMAAVSPEPNLLLADKMIINAEINNIKPIICINKTDLDKREDLQEIYKSAGYDVICTSAENGIGIDNLIPYLKNRITAFAGLSGVGKSSILNILTDAFLETGKISDKIQRGKHTTRHVELIELSSGGFVLDTPGFSSLEVDNIKADQLELYFPEIAKHHNECRFRGCSHINEPNCVIRDEVNSGVIAPSRYESYKELFAYLKTIKDWER